MSYDDEQTYDYDETTPDAPQETEQTNKYPMFFIACTSGLVVLAVTWLWYTVNDEWYWVLIPLLLVNAVGYVLYKKEPALSVQAFVTAVCLVHTWLVFFAEPNIIAFVTGVVLVALMLRVVLIYARGTEREAILESFRELEEPVKIDHRLAIRLKGDNERYVLVTNLHVIETMGWFVAMAAWFLAMTWAYLVTDLTFTVFLVMLAVGEILLVIKPLLWHREIVCLTTHNRLFILKGILEKSTPATSVDKITDKTTITPRLSTILSWMRIIKAPYGYYIVETAGQNQAKTKIEAKIGPIPFIDAFERAITQMMTPTPKDEA